MISAYHRREEIFGPDGLRYGWEWEPDGFDDYVDTALLKLYRHSPSEPSERPRVALDIGCGTGLRASRLAKLGVFDKVIACDFGDRLIEIRTREDFIKAAHTVTGRAPSQIEFKQLNVTKMHPDDFKGLSITHINCRNVLHFLSPPHARQALNNMLTLISKSGSLSLSFDGGDNWWETPPSIFDDSAARTFYKEHKERDGPGAAYQWYDDAPVRDYIQSQNFQINGTQGMEQSRVRPTERHIFAFSKA